MGGGWLGEDQDAIRGEMQVKNQWDPKLNVRLGRLVAEGSVRTIGLELPEIGKKAGLKGLWGLRMLRTERGSRGDYWITDDELRRRGQVPEQGVMCCR